MRIVKLACAVLLGLLAIFSIFVVGKLKLDNFPVKGYLIGDKLNFNNIVDKELPNKRSFTIEVKPGHSIQQILVERTIDKEKKDIEYDIYTPSQFIQGYNPYKRNWSDSFLQITNNAFASIHHCNHQDIKCDYFVDTYGNRGWGCWCNN